MTTVAFRLPDELVDAVDQLVRDGTYRTRTDAMRAALRMLLLTHDRRRTDQAIIDGYARLPQTDEELALATAMTRALIEEEPW